MNYTVSVVPHDWPLQSRLLRSSLGRNTSSSPSILQETLHFPGPISRLSVTPLGLSTFKPPCTRSLRIRSDYLSLTVLTPKPPTQSPQETFFLQFSLSVVPGLTYSLPSNRQPPTSPDSTSFRPPLGPLSLPVCVTFLPTLSHPGVSSRNSFPRSSPRHRVWILRS